MLVVPALAKTWVIILYLLLTESRAPSLHRRGPRKTPHIVDAIRKAGAVSMFSAPSRVQWVNRLSDFDCGHDLEHDRSSTATRQQQRQQKQEVR